MTKIALIGNPNSGNSSLFNLLTRTNQPTGGKLARSLVLLGQPVTRWIVLAGGCVLALVYVIVERSTLDPSQVITRSHLERIRQEEKVNVNAYSCNLYRSFNHSKPYPLQ